jgi:VCBS repeat-containing protein
VSGNDSDVDSATLTYGNASDPANGSVTLNGDGTYTYTPDLNFCGTDTFTYEVSDESLSDTGTVTIEVACVNDAPMAGDDSNATDEDTPVGGSVSGNDSDVDSATLTYGNASDPANGSVTLNGDGTYTYTPDLNFCGTDTFTYDASDGSLTDTATVTIVVACVNDAPVAADSAATTAEDTPLLASVSSTDVDGGAPTYAVISGPSHGTLVLNASTGAYTYTPNANYNGPDAFSFSVDDGAGGTDSGNVSITVAAVNDAPVCTAAGPSIGSLWPANHSLINVNVLGVTDPVEGSAITITITGIWQDEPTNTIGDGNTLIDGFGVGTSTAQVRAERSGAKRTPGDGRMYHIFFTGTDAEGGECTGTVKVGVPHDQGQDGTIGDGGPLYNSTGS